MKKILLMTPTSNQVLTFRRNLIDKLQQNGYDVSVLTLDNIEKKEIENRGIHFYYFQDANRSINPLKIITARREYATKIMEINPDFVFTFMLKPNTFGVLAAHDCGVKNIFSMVEGAGDPFIYNTIKWRIIRKVVCFLYKKSFKYSKKIFFLNNDDATEFQKLKLVNKDQTQIVHGIGVDLEKFAFKPVNVASNRFLMVARLLETKGVLEYIKCAELVKKTHPEAQFDYLGGEGTVKIADIQPWLDNGTINYFGNVKDVRPYLEDCLAFILPSKYREGLPMSIMEAEAVGRAIITTDNVGCRDTVIDEYNGYLVEQKDYETMAKKCIEVLENKEKAEILGRNARIFAEENFDQKIINETILSIIQETP